MSGHTDRRDRRGRARRLAMRAAIVAGCALLVCACNTDQQVAAAPDVPSDYRLAPSDHASREADHTLRNLRRLQSRRAQCRATRGSAGIRRRLGSTKPLAELWSICRSAPATSVQRRRPCATIRSILAASGVPADGIVVRGYHPPGRQRSRTIHITYPKISAQAGPCGLWPQDIGPSLNRDYFENQPPWNFGCATQRNLAAMVDNPADLVQPRAETPAYEMRRTAVMDKYLLGSAHHDPISDNDIGQDQRPWPMIPSP